MAVGGSLVIFSRGKTLNTGNGEALETPCRYRLVSDGEAVRETADRADRPRWVHPTRDLERALAPLSVEGIHLQRNQMREFSVLKGSR
jgi:hypothetical protein